MIAEAGHFALVLTLMLAMVAAVLPHIGIRRGNTRFMGLADSLSLGQFLLTALAFAALTYSFLISDFSLKVVATNSHTAKPFLYKISGVWGNHEGSLLLWVLILTLFAGAVSVFGRNLPQAFRARVLSVQSALVVGFLLFILLTSNPFERLLEAPAEGNGLNPLLQDPGLAFHPPMLYLGYVGLSIAFSFAVATLIDGEVTPAWARWVRPWTLAAWIFLTGGIALGSWWAYYELGWGGWWFWDPVENASFMPWLAATALLHSAIVVEKRDALKSWTLLLAIVAFSFSLLGTFLVRSGVLTSVHAFATDPERGLFILAFLTLVIGGSLTLFALRADRLAPGGLFQLVSRESALVLNNILLATFAGVVLIGTLYPLMLEAIAGEQITVGPPFFDFATVVLVIPLIIALGVGPMLAWKRARLGRAIRLLVPAAAIAGIGALGLLWAEAGGYVMSAVGLGLGIWLICASLLELLLRIKLFAAPGRAVSRLGGVTRAQWGMLVAHMGVGVVVLGVSLSEAFTQETLTTLVPGERAEVGGYSFQFTGVEPVAGPNYSAVRARFLVWDGDVVLTQLLPEDRVYTNPPMTTTEAAIAPLWTGDLYAVIGENADSIRPGAWSVRLYFKPMVSALWLGAILMMIGGVLSLSDRRLRLGVPTGKRQAPPAKTSSAPVLKA